MSDFLKRALSGFAETLQPLRDALASPDALATFLRQFGWTLGAGDLANLVHGLGDLKTLAADPSSLGVEQLATDLGKAAGVIRGIATGGTLPAFANSFPAELLDYLVYMGAAQHAPPLFGLLHFGGVFDEQRVAADAASGRDEYVRRAVHWDRIASLAGDPLGTLRSVYGWGGAFDARSFLRSLGILVRGFGGSASLYATDRLLVDQYYAPGSGAGVQHLLLTAAPLDQSVGSGLSAASVKLALLMMGIPPDAATAASPDGLAIMPVITGKAGETFALSDRVSLTLAGDVLARPIHAEIHPTRAVLRAAPGDAHIDSQARLTASAAAGAPWIPIGDAASSRLEIASAHGAVGFSGQLDGDFELTVELGVDSAALIVDFGEGDGLVQRTAGSQPSRNQLAFTVRWSNKSGFSFGGSPRLEVTLPVQASALGLSVQQVGIAVGASSSGGGGELDLTVSGSAHLGPITATLADVGMRVELAAQPGNLGNADLGFGFKPPSGIGLSLDGSVISGGGFLAHQDHEYQGALDLSVYGVAVKAFGLIETKLPGGASGYSALIDISTEFSPGFQLGYGFTLDGVGGLVGINRTINIGNVQSAIWGNHFDGLLFPKDPVAAAPSLMTAIDSYFPAAEGRYLFGPLAKIGWGGGMMEALLGLLLEVPEPIKLLLLGEIDVQVPVDLPQLVLHIDFDGGIDFGQKLAFFDAKLHDSKIESYPIGGDLAFRYGWGDSPVFALAIGGFHPHYQPPANFPALQRLSISIGEPGVTLTAQGYFALTSNSLQFGAKIELTAGVSALHVHGHLSFDALVEWNPFAFEFDLSAGVELCAGSTTLASVQLDGTVSGTAPWHVSADASISFLFFDISVHVDKQWGDTPNTLPANDPTPLVQKALSDPTAWSSVLPRTARAVVTTAGSPSDAGSAVLVDPAGGLRIAQRVAPLGQAVTRFNGSALAKPITVTIDSPNVFGDTQPAPTTEEFAVAQFENLSDDQKLSLPSFTPLQGGIEVGGDNVDLGQSSRSRSVKTSLDYETTIVPSTGPVGTYTLSTAAQAAMNARVTDTPTPPSKTSLAQERYVIAGIADLKARNDIATDGSKLGALQSLANYLHSNPAARGQLQVVLDKEAA